MTDLRFRVAVAAAAVAAEALCNCPARAQSAPPSAASAPTVEHEIRNAPGQYLGVVPGAQNPPAVKVPPGAVPALVTWPGFQMLPDGGSRVFLQVTAPVELSTEIKPDKVVVTLKRVKVAGRNNRRPLETRFFNTPVTRVALSREGKDTLVVLELRSQSAPSVTREAAATGYHFVFFDFPAGNWISTPEAEAAAEPLASGLPPSPYPSLKVATSARPQRPGAAAAARLGSSASLEAQRAGGAASVKGSASVGASTTSSKAPPLTEEQLRALDDEKPPPVRTTVGGSIRLRN